MDVPRVALELLAELSRLVSEKEGLAGQFLALTLEQARLAEHLAEVGDNDEAFETGLGEVTRIIDSKQALIDRVTAVEGLSVRVETRLREVFGTGDWGGQVSQVPVWTELTERRNRIRALLSQAHEADQGAAHHLLAVRQQITGQFKEARVARQALSGYQPAAKQWDGVFVDRKK